MSDSTIRDEIRREVGAIFKNLGLPSNPQRSALSNDDQRKAAEIARRIIDSNFDKSELGGLDRNLLSAVALTIQEIISSRYMPTHELEEMNPYYTPFGTRLIRDQ
jgi:hypothetical protein